MRLRALVPLVLAACSPSARPDMPLPRAPGAAPTPASAAPVAPVSAAPASPAPSAAPASEPVADTGPAATERRILTQRSRRGECALEPAIDAFLAGQEAVRCGDLGARPGGADYEQARACALAAWRAQKPFSLIWGGPGIDSVMRDAVAARKASGRYEVQWFSYDSCPAGCGDRDPSWNSVRCEPLVDLRAACVEAARRKKRGAETDWPCDEDGVRTARRRFELRCDGGQQVGWCGPPVP